VELSERPKSAAFDPNKRYPSHYLNIFKENPGSLLISGAVLQEGIEKTFRNYIKFLNDEISEEQQAGKKSKRKQSAIGGNRIKSLNEMMN